MDTRRRVAYWNLRPTATGPADCSATNPRSHARAARALGALPLSIAFDESCRQSARGDRARDPASHRRTGRGNGPTLPRTAECVGDAAVGAGRSERSAAASCRPVDRCSRLVRSCVMLRRAIHLLRERRSVMVYRAVPVAGVVGASVASSVPLVASATTVGPLSQASGPSTVAVTRNNTPDPATLPTDQFVVVARNGAASFDPEARVTPTSFDTATAPTRAASSSVITRASPTTAPRSRRSSSRPTAVTPQIAPTCSTRR